MEGARVQDAVGWGAAWGGVLQERREVVVMAAPEVQAPSEAPAQVA